MSSYLRTQQVVTTERVLRLALPHSRVMQAEKAVDQSARRRKSVIRIRIENAPFGDRARHGGLALSHGLERAVHLARAASNKTIPPALLGAGCGHVGEHEDCAKGGHRKM